MQLELGDDEVEYLQDILTIWLDGYEEAENEALRDPLIESFEDLTASAASLSEGRRMAEDMLERLKGD